MTFVLVWGAPRLIWLVVQSNYRVWSQALTPLGLNAAARLSVGLTYDLGLAMVMTTALRGRDKTTLSGLSQLLRALPALIPAWLVSETNTAWSLWVSWSGWFRRGSLPIGEVLEIQLAVFGLELLLVLAATVGIGVLYPVVLQEGRSLPGGVSRAWGLMHGARWRFASLFLIYLAMISVISLPDTWVVIVRAGADVRGVAKWITGGFSDAADALWCVVVVASYMELRSIGDGASELEVAQAFT